MARLPLTRMAVAGASLVLGLTGCPVTPAAPTPEVPRPQPTPRIPTAEDPFTHLDSEYRHTCGVRQSGTILCWGKNTYGQLGGAGRRDMDRFVKVGGVPRASTVAVGRDFSCALTTAKRVWCWGNNEDGQLGDGRGGRPGAMSRTPVRVVGLDGVQSIVAGHYHACALQRSGRVMCWGNGADGQLGSDRQRAFARPRIIDHLRTVKAIASGSAHVCALEASGQIKCWGRNTEGQLGIGASGSRIKPVLVTALDDATVLGAGGRHTCAATAAGRLACWGDHSRNQLGPRAGESTKRRSPVTVPDVGEVAEILGGGRHGCVRLAGGKVQCWGDDASGQIGVNAGRTVSRPRLVPDLADARALALGEAHTCMVTPSGAGVRCRGDDAHGALGPSGS